MSIVLIIMGAIMNRLNMMARPFMTIAGGTCCTPRALRTKRRDHHDLHVGRDHHQEKRSKAQQSHAHNEIQRIDARHAYSPTLPRLTTCTPSVPFKSHKAPLADGFARWRTA